MNNNNNNNNKYIIIIIYYNIIYYIISNKLDPIYRREVTTPSRYFDDPKEVEIFWKGLWEVSDRGNPRAEWLKEIEEVFVELVPVVSQDSIDITESVCHNAIRKKKNWSSLGPDLICNFWWKKLTSVKKVMLKIFSEIINKELGITAWFCRGRTILIPKMGEWSIPNQRPITCLNTQYKWFTSVILFHLNQHLYNNQLMQIDQRGANAKCSGTVDNLLIDDMIMRDAGMNQRDLSLVWIDVRKAFDSVSHSWLKKMFQLHRVPKKITNVVSSIIDKWNVVLQIPGKDGSVESDTIQFWNGELQGDSCCPAMYTLTTNPVSWKIRSFQGYVLSKPIKEKVTHALFIDDLKCYVKKKLVKKTMMTIKECMRDSGLLWNSKKCKRANLTKGKFDIVAVENLEQDDGFVIESLKEGESYKYMGVPQSDRATATVSLTKWLMKTVKQRSYIIWSSDLSDFNKVVACNIFVNSCVEYYFWTQRFTINALQEMDRSVRKAMNIWGGKHTNLMNSALYLPRSKGGRGLRSIERMYKEVKVKLAIKVLHDTDRRMNLVKRFHMNCMTENHFSIFKDAQRYAKQMDFDLIIGQTLSL